MESNAAPVATTGVAEEDILVWNHLSNAGFLRSRFVFSSIDSAATLPRNQYGGFVDFA